MSACQTLTEMQCIVLVDLLVGARLRKSPTHLDRAAKTMPNRNKGKNNEKYKGFTSLHLLISHLVYQSLET